MLRGDFRPWGQLNWVLERLSVKKWSLLGCIGPEDRSLACWEMLRDLKALKGLGMLEIHDEHPQDPHHSRFYERTSELLDEQRAKFLSDGGAERDIDRFYLADLYGRIIDYVDQFAASSAKNVVVDISSLPKRFFFPIIRRLLGSRRIRNLVATYAIPARYSEGQLSEDPEISTYLPTFLPPDEVPEDHIVIVGLGYEPLGLRQVLAGRDFHVLFPYPSLPPGVRRNWEFVRQISPLITRPPERVYIYDVSETFERILAITNQGTRFAVLAPYGPKPMSLAMCLYAVSSRSGTTPPAVFYTQPRVYNPEYSMGVRMERGVPKVFAYCLRLRGRDLF